MIYMDAEMVCKIKNSFPCDFFLYFEIWPQIV